MSVRAVGLMLLLTLPGAAAFTAEMEFPAAPIEPDLGPVDADLVLTATCQEVWERTPPALAQALEVEVNPTFPEGTSISGPTTVLLDTTPCTTGTEGDTSAISSYTFAVTRAAPGLASIPVALDATLSGGELGEPTTAQVDGSIMAGFYGAMQAEVSEPAQTVGAQEPATFTVTLTNVGNAPTTVMFSLPGTGPAATTITLPPATVVGSTAHGQENTETVTITAVVDPEYIGFLNEIVPFEVVMTTHATEDPTQLGNELPLSLLMRVRDVKGAPAPTALLVAPALLGAALLARRRT